MQNAFCIRKIITSLALGDNYSRLARAINTSLRSALNTSTSACVKVRAYTKSEQQLYSLIYSFIHNAKNKVFCNYRLEAIAQR